MSSEEIRELEITDKFQEIKRLFDMYPELINLVTSEIKSNMDQHLITDGSSLDLIKETIATSIQDGINQELSTILNLYKTEINTRYKLVTKNIKLKKRVKFLIINSALFNFFSIYFFIKWYFCFIFNGIVSKL